MKAVKKHSTFFSITFFVLSVLTAFSAQAKLSYEGYLTNSTSLPLSAQAVVIKLQIRSPGSENCLLFEETHSLTTGNDGYFSLAVGGGTRTDSTGLSFTRIFENQGAMSSLTCTSGTSYSPSVGDERKMAIQVSANAGSTFDALGSLTLRSVPTAHVAESLSGYKTNNLLRTTLLTDTAPSLSSSDFTELSALLAGTSTQYLKTQSTIGASLPVVSGTPSTPATGSIWYDSTAGAVKYYNGSTAQSLGGGGGGGVTTISTGTGLIGGPITSTGSLSVDVGTTANKIVQLNGSGLLPAVDGSLLTGVDASKLRGTTIQSGLAPAAGDFLKYVGSYWTTGSVHLSELKSSIGGGALFSTTACTANQTLQYTSATDTFDCIDISIPSGAQLFTASGSFTIPAGVKKIKATVIGAGGGGCTSMGSGASGAAGFSMVNKLTPGDIITITVGSGGTSSASGTNGTDSSFGTYVVAPGGGGCSAGTTPADPSYPSAAPTSPNFIYHIALPSIKQTYSCGNGGSMGSSGQNGCILLEW